MQNNIFVIASRRRGNPGLSSYAGSWIASTASRNDGELILCTHSQIRISGFTLVELSIVMVIIGLLIGGIIVGQDLIVQSSTRAQMAQIETIETEVNTFKVKYNCLPGDCATATDIFGTTDPSGNAINNGNGDGIIKATYYAGADVGAGECLAPQISGEVSQLFLHLYLAGFGDRTKGSLMAVPGRIGIEYPYAKFNNTGVIVSCTTNSQGLWTKITPIFLRRGNIIIVGVSGSVASGDGSRIGYATGQFGVAWYGGFGNTPTVSLSPIGIPATAARMIDEKIDAGKPSSGKFGIIAGQTGCDNVLSSQAGSALLAAYPSPSVACNTSVGKRID